MTIGPGHLGVSTTAGLALEVAEQLARLQALRPCDGRRCAEVAHAEAALGEAERRFGEAQQRREPRAQTALESARRSAWICGAELPPSHRVGLRGRLVTRAKRALFERVMRPVLRSRLERQEAFNVALLEVLERTVERARLGAPQEPGWASSALAPLARRGWPARQRRWNQAVVEALSGNAGALEKVEALACPVPRAVPPVLRAGLASQEAFNRDVLVTLTDIAGTRPAGTTPPPRVDASAYARAWEAPAVERVRGEARGDRTVFRVLVLDGPSSNREAVAATRESAAAFTARGLEVRVVRGDALERAALEPSADVVALLRPGERLTAAALDAVAAMFARVPVVGAVYGDEDTWPAGGERSGPWLKPSPSLELLRAVDLCGALFVRRTVLETVGPWREGWGEATRYELVLRLLEAGVVLERVPLVLCHQPRGGRLPTCGAEGLRALAAHLERAGERAMAEEGEVAYRAKYLPPEHPPLVSLVVPFRDQPALLRQLLESFRQTRWTNWELLLVSNESREPETHALLAAQVDPRVRVLEWNHPFNYSAVNNAAVREARGEVLVFLNNDVEILHPDWLDELVAQALRPTVGAVGAQLLFPDGTLQHAGVVVGITGFAGHPFWRMAGDTGMTPFGHPGWPREWLAVTGACLAVRRASFERVGGFDERFAVCGSDVDLCLKLHARGLRTVYTPHARLRHHESASRRLDGIPAGDFWHSYVSYRPWLKSGDPAYHPALSLADAGCGLAQGPEDGAGRSLAALASLLPAPPRPGNPESARVRLHEAEHLLGRAPARRAQSGAGRPLRSVRAWLPAGRQDDATLGWPLALLDAATSAGVRVEWAVHGKELSPGAWARRLGAGVRVLREGRELDGLEAVDLAFAADWLSACWALRDTAAAQACHLFSGPEAELFAQPGHVERRIAAEVHGPGAWAAWTGPLGESVSRRFSGRGLHLPPHVPDTQVPPRAAARRGGLRAGWVGEGFGGWSETARRLALLPGGDQVEWIRDVTADAAVDVVVDASVGAAPHWEALRWMAGGAATVAGHSPWRIGWERAGAARLVAPHPVAVAEAVRAWADDPEARRRAGEAAAALAGGGSAWPRFVRLAVAMGFQLE